MGDVSKLPKWAQDQMASMQMRVRQLEAERDQILAGGGGDHSLGYRFESYQRDVPPVPASIGDRRLIWRGTNGGIMLTQEETRPSGITWLRLNGLDGDGLQVRPHVANVVFVRCIEHGEG